MTYSGITIKQLANALERDPDLVKAQLFRLGIKSILDENLYPESALDELKKIRPKGRPKKQPEAEATPKSTPKKAKK